MKFPTLSLTARLALVTLGFFLVTGAMNYQNPAYGSVGKVLLATFTFALKGSIGPFIVALVITLLHWAGHLDFSGRAHRTARGTAPYAGDDHSPETPAPGAYDSPYDAYGHVKTLSDD